MQTHHILTADWLVLEAWTHADVHRCDCSRAVITAVTPSPPHTHTHHRATVPAVERPNACAFVLWCEKLRGWKSPEKAFSSSGVTRVQVAPSRLINSSNEAWILNTYRWNGASTLAALFHRMRIFQIARLWLKHLVPFLFFSLPLNPLSLRDSSQAVFELPQNQTKQQFLPLRAESCLTALHHYLRQCPQWPSDPFSSRISILFSCWMIFQDVFSRPLATCHSSPPVVDHRREQDLGCTQQK